MPIIDVALVRNTLGQANRDAIDRANLIRAPIDLGSSLWIGRLDHDTTTAIVEACEPPGLNVPLNRPWGVMYTLYRTDPPEVPESRYQWDPDRRISLGIRMSRLVHPTSIGYEFTARVVDNGASAPRVIAPSHIKGWGTRAYVVDTQNNWLTIDHAAEMRRLLAVYDHAQVPERVKSALFYFEYAALTYFIDLRWVAITTACESLVHIDGEREPSQPQRYARSTNVFVTRMARLSALALDAPLSEADLIAMYRQRSALAHGQDFTGLTPEKRRLYCLQEDALRAILRKAVLERQFAELFQSDASVQAAFPL